MSTIKQIKVGGTTYDIIDTDTKVTSVANHYTPAADSNAALSADASSTTAATWGSTDLVTGVNIQRDAKGHVTGVTVDSIQMPSKPTFTETALTITDKTGTDTSDLVYAVTNLVEGGTKGHTITPTYTGLPTKTYVDNRVTNGVEYKGTVSSLATLHSAELGNGDFVRVSAVFTIGGETAHVGDIIIATSNAPASASTTSMGGYDLLHTEVDTVVTESIVSGWGFTKNTGDITGVTAGNGLTGGATSGTATLNVGAGNGITVVADAVSAKAGTGITVDSTGINVSYGGNGSATTASRSDHTHGVTTSTSNAAPHTHTHSVTVSGTTGNDSANTSVAKGTVSSTGTGATVATGSSGTATVLTGVKVSSTATVVQDTSTYGVDATGTATVVTGVAANGTTTALTGVKSSGSVTVVQDTSDYGVDATGTASVVTGVAANGTATALTGVKVSGSSSAAPGGHTHTVTVSGTTGNNSGTAVAAVTGLPNFSGGSGTTKYLHHSHTAASLGTASTGTVGISGGSVSTSTASFVKTAEYNETTKILTITTGNAVTSVTHTAATLTGTKTFVTGYPNFSGGSGSLTSNTTASGGIKYIETHTAASLGTLSTANAAPHTHTHSYGSSTALTTSTNSGTNFNAATAVASDGTATVLTGVKASGTTTVITGSAGTSSASKKTTVITGVTSNGTATVLTGVKASGTTTAITGTAGTSSSSKKTTAITGVGADGTATAVTGVSTSKLDLVNVAAHTHTHDFSATPTTGNNSGSAVKAITAVTVKASE